MTCGFLQNSVMNNTMIKSSIACMSTVSEAVEVLKDVAVNRRSKRGCSSRLSRPRLPPSILLLTGGKDGITAASSCEAYDSRTDSWVTVTFDLHRAHHEAVTLDGFVYLIGGCSRETHLNTVQRLDLSGSTRHHVAPMNSARCYVSAVVLQGCIYAMGGFNGQTCLNTVERYSPEADRWTMVAHMCAKRCRAGATVLEGKVGAPRGRTGGRGRCCCFHFIVHCKAAPVLVGYFKGRLSCFLILPVSD